MSTFGHVRRLATIDVTRAYRNHANLRGGASSLLSLVVFVALLLVGTVGGGVLGYYMGQTLAANGVLFEIGELPIGIARGIVALFWLMFVLVFGIRAVGQRGTLPEPTGILTVVPTGQALLGLLVAEFVYVLIWLFLPGLGLGVGLALGAGTLLPVVAVPLAVLAAGLTGLFVGYPVGLAVRHVASRFAFVAQHKALILVAVFGLYFVALASGAWNQFMASLLEPMQLFPTGWYADLLFFGIPGVAVSTGHILGALFLTVVVPLLGYGAGVALAKRHWFSDPALAGVEASAPTAADAEPGLERRLETVLGAGTAALVTLSWRRAVRSPLKLLYAFYPLLILAGLFADIVQSGQIPTYLPYAILLFAAWAAGVIFTLNPLGDQGAALASTLLSRISGRTFVRAHVLAGLVVAVPLGMLATAIVGILSPLDGQTVGLLVVATPVVMVVAAMLSIGLGMAFPRFEATNVTRSMKTVLPSRMAFLLFSIHLFATAAAAAIVSNPGLGDLAAWLISWLLPFGLAVEAGTLYWIAAVMLVPLVLSPLLAYRYAVRRFDRYTFA